MRKGTAPMLLGLCCVIQACGSDHSVTKPPGGGDCVPAGAAASLRPGVPGLNLVTDPNGGPLAPFEGVTVNASALGGCVQLAADGGTYLVVPQFATDAGGTSSVPFQVSAGSGAQAAVVRQTRVQGGLGRPAESLQLRFDERLRRMESRFAAGTPASLAKWRASADRVQRATLPAVGSTRTFQVLNSIDGSGFVTDTAVLRFVGTTIMIYVDQNAPAAPEGFSDAQLTALGTEFDQELLPIDVRTFGSPSDIDQNGHVIVLFTPTVNALTPASECSTQGFVAGFFFGLDLEPTQTGSNQAEIFYSLVPDAAGKFSCAHSSASVNGLTPAVFIHEFQHMISWNQHVILRGGSEEDLWLNEGMSHIAEEMGSRFFENKYPPPQDRSSPNNIFPDSANDFISGDLVNAYMYLLDPTQVSLPGFFQGGSLEERGAAWLFLRWLGDQTDSTIYTKLEQTNLVGLANVQAATGRTFEDLDGDFGLAVYTDSLPGVPRSSIPTQFRFTSRNMRFLFDAVARALGGPPQAPRPFPILTKHITAPAALGSSMVPGTNDFFVVQMPNTGGTETLQFSQPGGTALSPILQGQVSVFRCPSATACP